VVVAAVVFVVVVVVVVVSAKITPTMVYGPRPQSGNL
jgi:hypothetical protein